MDVIGVIDLGIGYKTELVGEWGIFYKSVTEGCRTLLSNSLYTNESMRLYLWYSLFGMQDGHRMDGLTLACTFCLWWK